MSKLRRDGARGQSAVEYLGLVVLVAAVVATLLVLTTDGLFASAYRAAVCRITSLTGDGRCNGQDTRSQTEHGDSNPPDGNSPDRGGPGDDNPDNGREPGQNKPDKTPKLDEQQVRHVADMIRDHADWGGYRGGEVGDIRRALANMSPAELAALFDKLSDREIKALFADPWLADKVMDHSTLERLMRSAPLDTLRRISDVVPGEIDPRFDEAGDFEDVTYKDSNSMPFVVDQGDKRAISPTDIDQGGLGDCWLLSALATTAKQNPQIIRNMISRNPNGTFTVRFYNDDGEPVHVTVTPDLPMNNGRVFSGNSGTVDKQFGTPESWPAIIEKAYAKWKGGYHNIEGGVSQDAWQAFTGHESQSYDMDELSVRELSRKLKSGHGIVVSSFDEESTPYYKENPNDGKPTLHTNHIYYVTEVNKKAGTVTIRNPWGWSYPPITMPYDDFVNNFLQIGASDLT